MNRHVTFPPGGGPQSDFDPLASPLTALVYDEAFPIGAMFRVIVDRARGRGLRIGGVVEKPAEHRGHRCDMALEDLASGEAIQISEERGAMARGCRLDLDALTRACALTLASLPHCDLVLINKFGKAEAEGGGFRCVISDALTLGVPAVIGVPRRNLASWRAFAGALAVECDLLSP
jgi:nucleoside-triphosphatase THEP1